MTASDGESLGSKLASLVLVGMRSFAATLMVMGLAGVVLAGISGYVLREHPFFAAVAVAAALFESAAAGILLGTRRAVVMATAHGIRAFHVGQAAVNAVFSLLGVPEEQSFMERGGAVARTVERLPLAQAEARLGQAVESLVHAQPAGGGLSGWLRRGIQARLLGAAQTITLARFREDGAREGGVDLALVRQTLHDQVEDQVIRKLRAGMNVWTIVVILGLPLLVAVQVCCVYLVLHSHG